jgi:hypothetical protein
MLAALNQVSVLDAGLSFHPVLAQAVTFQFGAAGILGLCLAGAGAGLYLLRSMRPELARDYDIFFSAIGLLCGGILFFNGWRLDPILMFGQALLGGSAIFFAFESIRLRSITTDQARRNGGSQPIVDDDRAYSVDRVYRAELDEIEPFMDQRPPVRRIRGSRDSEPADVSAYRDSYSNDSYSNGSYSGDRYTSSERSSRRTSSSPPGSRSPRSSYGEAASYDSDAVSGYDSAYGSPDDIGSGASGYTSPGYSSRRTPRESPPSSSRRSSSRQPPSSSRDRFYNDEPPAPRSDRASRQSSDSRRERPSRSGKDDYVDYKPISNYSDSSSAYGSRRPSSDYDDEWGAS